MSPAQRQNTVVRALARVWLAGVLGLGASASWAQGIVVESGASMTAGAGTLEMGCTDLQVAPNGFFDLQAATLAALRHVGNAGQLNGGSGLFDLNGNWTNSGTFAAGTSTVQIGNACGTATVVSGANVFYNFRVPGVGKSLRFTAGQTQTVLNQLQLVGASSGNRLLIDSTTPGSFAYLRLAQGGSQQVQFVNVRDNAAVGQQLAPDFPSVFQSVDGGNTPGWFRNERLDAVRDVPVLGWPAMALLVGLMAAVGGWRRRGRTGRA